MKAKVNLFHPNTTLEFMDDHLRISVCLCVSYSIWLLLKKKGRKCIKGKQRYTVYLRFATKDYSRDNIIRIQAFLLIQLMKLIREAKKDLLEESIINLSTKQEQLTVKEIQLKLF